MNVHEAIANAEAVLPGVAALDGEEDPRWQVIIALADFVDDEPDLLWSFVEQWGQPTDEDLQAAIATCLLEHLLESHFDLLFPRVEHLVRSNGCFARTAGMCWKFGEAEHPENAARWKELLRELKDRCET
jgi:hypothetical protein